MLFRYNHHNSFNHNNNFNNRSLIKSDMFNDPWLETTNFLVQNNLLSFECASLNVSISHNSCDIK